MAHFLSIFSEFLKKRHNKEGDVSRALLISVACQLTISGLRDSLCLLPAEKASDIYKSFLESTSSLHKSDYWIIQYSSRKTRLFTEYLLDKQTPKIISNT